MFKTLFYATLAFLIFGNPHVNAAQKKTDAPTSLKRILILGDSLTEGYGVSKDEAFPALVEQKLNKNKNKKAFDLVAAGSSGSTSASALKRLKWHLKKPTDLLVIALGGNDGLRGIEPEATQANLDKAIVFAQSKNVKVVLAGMKIPMNYGADYRNKFEKTYTELSKKHKIKLIPFLLEGVGGVKSLNLPDGIHPNEKGHKIIAETVYKSLEGLL